MEEENKIQNKSSKSLIIIIIVGILLLCCIVVVVGGIALVYIGQRAEDSATNIVDDVITDEYDFSLDEDENIPTIKDVTEAYNSASSYRFSGNVTFGDELMIIHGEYLFPSSEYYYTSDISGIIEEIAIDNVFYIKYDDGAWQITDDPYNSNIQREEIFTVLEGLPETSEGILLNNEYHFYYYDEDNMENWSLVVSRDTYLPARLTLEYTDEETGSVVYEEINFLDWNASDIKVEAPL